MLATRSVFDVSRCIPVITTLLLASQLLFVTNVHALGGRKIAIVVDNSHSNLDTDPSGLRVNAAKSINDMLISNAEAGDGKVPDSVCVVAFSGEGSLIYPLGDPAGATFDE